MYFSGVLQILIHELLLVLPLLKFFLQVDTFVYPSLPSHPSKSGKVSQPLIPSYSLFYPFEHLFVKLPRLYPEVQIILLIEPTMRPQALPQS